MYIWFTWSTNYDNISPNLPKTRAFAFGYSAFKFDENYNKKEEYGFPFINFLNLINLIMWLRLFGSISQTKIAGPMFRIIFAMMKELLAFFLVWFLLLIGLTT
jgi:hypothetical protein